MHSAIKIALVGRANVGKSTLFNCFSKQKTAMVYDMPGVTRDCRKEFMDWMSYQFELIDTPGIDLYDDPSLKSQVLARIQETINESDYIWFLTDGTAGLTNFDREIARLVRKSGKPVILLINKNDKRNFDNTPFFELGFASVVALSAEHKFGLYEIFSCMDENLLEAAENTTQYSSIAILGRPNAGKSTLVNTILGKNYQLMGSQPGLTRESVGYPFTFNDMPYMLVDTAGLRRRNRVKEDLEKMSVKSSLESLRFAECVVFLIDTTALSEYEFDQQDLVLISRTIEEGRCCIIGLSKWDTVKDPKQFLSAVKRNLELKGLSFIPLVPISSFKKMGITKLFETIEKALACWNMRLSTSKLNAWLRESVEHKAPHPVKGRIVKMKFATQIKTRPPRIVIFVNVMDSTLETYKRYLVNRLREMFGFEGVPIRITFKCSDNPYVQQED